MRFYKVTADGMEHAIYECTTAEAKERAKETLKTLSDTDKNTLRVELIEIVMNQRVMADILSRWGCTHAVLRTWLLTARGGLKEIANGE